MQAETFNGLSTPRLRPNIDVRAAGGETLVHDPVSGQVHVLNAAAAHILAQCDGATPLDAIVDEIVARTAVERERAQRDAQTIVAQFGRNRLLS